MCACDFEAVPVFLSWGFGGISLWSFPFFLSFLSAGWAEVDGSLEHLGVLYTFVFRSRFNPWFLTDTKSWGLKRSK